MGEHKGPAGVADTRVEFDPFAGPSIARVVPTTEAQREVWLACQLGREASLAFNESITLEIKGPLDVELMQAALATLTARHEALRASVSPDGTELLIASDFALHAALEDLTGLGARERADALARAKARAVETEFDLATGSLVRASLMKLGREHHSLLITAHHIVCDGWSFGVLVRELIETYRSSVSGVTPNLDPADGFGDYSLSLLEAEATKQQRVDEDYWVSKFDGDVPVLDLPLDHPRPARREFASLREDLLLDQALVAALRKATSQLGASLFSSLLGCFGALVGRYSGATTVVCGVPAAGQSAAGLHSLVGHCVHLLPVRIDLKPEQPAAGLVAVAQTAVLDAYDHQHCTFGSLLRKLRINRDPARLPLVAVQFNLDARIAPEDLAVSGLEVQLESNPRHFENFELFINATQAPEGIILECQYATTLFDRATVVRMLQHYRTMLERFVAAPTQPLQELVATDPADLATLALNNATAADFAGDATVPRLISAQCNRNPMAVAISSSGEAWTYGQLEENVNRLARTLRARGVKRGALVGLCLPRNSMMVAAQLATMKTGAAYVPLDPAFPPDRLRHMVDDARLAQIVTTSTLSGTVAFPREQMLLLDTDRAAIDQQSPAPLSPDAAADAVSTDPAYVIYTSGSTGTPKGVAVPHRAVVNFLTSMATRPGLAARDALVAVTTLSFDIAVLELFLPLVVGAKVVLATREQAIDGVELRKLLESSAATVMQATPATWRMVLEAGWVAAPGFRALVGGEALPVDLAQTLKGATRELWNMYGPTETTVWSTCWKVESLEPGIRIGTPIANTQVHVVDAAGRPVPIGVAGEICIGGEGVAIGYLNRPELTGEKFIPDQLSGGIAGRIYRTGDRGRWCNDGTIEHLGRLDFQVKVRGFRIELGDIEANLAKNPAVSRCVVIVREDVPGDARLVAYVVPSAGPIGAEDLKSHLRGSLPDYMLPQHFVSLEALPLTPNGKIDRKALPAPTFDHGQAGERRRVEPSDDTEREVLALTESVLKLRSLSVDDDFFSLGGHSLLAAKLISAVNRSFQISLPMRTAFEAATPLKLAKAVRQALGAGSAPVSRVPHVADQERGPLTVSQDRIRFMEELYPDRVVYNTPSAHRLKGALDVAAFGAAFAALVVRQPSLRTEIVRAADGVGFEQHVVPSIDASIPYVDLSGVPAAEREAELLRRMQAIVDGPMNIGVAPLFRSTLFRLGAEEHVWLFMPHHIIWDGWSFDLLYHEMAALYPAAMQSVPAGLPELSITYIDHAHWHAQWMRSEEYSRQLSFWKTLYGRIAPPNALPTDRPRLAGMSGAGSVEWVHIDGSLTERLREVARGADATLNMLTMAAYGAMLTGAVGGDAVIMGVPVRGRLLSDVEPIMGFFNNLLPAYVQIDVTQRLADCVRSVKRGLLDLFANQDVPFERLASEPELARLGQTSGLYQTLFSFQDARDRPRTWGPLQHSSVLVMQKGATEDFGLWLMEVPSGLEGGFNYNDDIVDTRTAEMFRRRYIALLGRIADHPAATIQELLAMPGADAEEFAEWVGRRRRAASDAPPKAPPRSVPAAAGANGGRNANEARLAEIWAELLGLEAAQISSGDNFFDLGGNSLLVMKAVEQSAVVFGAEIDPRRYVYESLEKLAAGPAPAGTSTDAGETTLRDVWAELLGVPADQISGDDNFFNLGGNSLLVMRAISDAERLVGFAVDPRRYVYESLRQLSVRPAGAAVAADPKATPAAAESRGLLSRIAGRFGRRDS